MTGNCSKCGAHLESAWTFCPHCAAPVPHQVEIAQHHDPERPPVKGSFTGLLFGVIAAPVLIIVGGMICLTGIGIFLGVPMIIAGVLAPLLGPVLGFSALKGSCPWCGHEVGSLALFDRFQCPSCGKNILTRKQHLIKAE